MAIDRASSRSEALLDLLVPVQAQFEKPSFIPFSTITIALIVPSRRLHTMRLKGLRLIGVPGNDVSV